MEEFEAEQQEKINDLENKLFMILDHLDKECNQDGIIIDTIKYLQLLEFLDEILKLMEDINIITESTEEIYQSIFFINRDIIEINKKHYDGEPYN
jgi:archaellum biogenesis ATPase FlaH